MPEMKWRFFCKVLLWMCLFYIAGWISLVLDNPTGHLGFVWLPAGIVVVAFIRTGYRHWPLFVAVFLLAGVMLDLQLEHEILSSSAISIFTILGGMLIAWRLRTVALRSDDLHLVIHWLVTTAVVTAPIALLGSSWVKIYDNLPIINTFGVWWAANVTGVIFLQPILTGMLGGRAVNVANNIYTRVVGVVIIGVICIFSWYLFGLEKGALEQLGNSRLSPLLFALTGIPIILAVLSTVLSGDRMGSLALFFLGMIVLYHASEERGPFFFSSMRQEGYLLLAQCYLVSASVLVVFMRVFSKSIWRPGEPRRLFADDTSIYRLDLDSGSVEWDWKMDRGVDVEVEKLKQVETLLELTHPNDRQIMTDRLNMHSPSSLNDKSHTFKLATKDGNWCRIVDKRIVILENEQGATLVGCWKLQQ